MLGTTRITLPPSSPQTVTLAPPPRPPPRSAPAPAPTPTTAVEARGGDDAMLLSGGTFYAVVIAAPVGACIFLGTACAVYVVARRCRRENEGALQAGASAAGGGRPNERPLRPALPPKVVVQGVPGVASAAAGAGPTHQQQQPSPLPTRGFSLLQQHRRHGLAANNGESSSPVYDPPWAYPPLAYTSPAGAGGLEPLPPAADAATPSGTNAEVAAGGATRTSSRAAAAGAEDVAVVVNEHGQQQAAAAQQQWW